MAGEEREHVVFGQGLLSLAQEGIIPQIFEDPYQVMQELESVEARVRRLVQPASCSTQVNTAFVMAYRLEFYLLSPAFTILLHYAASLSDSTGLLSPEETCEAHVNYFLEPWPAETAPAPSWSWPPWPIKIRLAVECADLEGLSVTVERGRSPGHGPARHRQGRRPPPAANQGRRPQPSPRAERAALGNGAAPVPGDLVNYSQTANPSHGARPVEAQRNLHLKVQQIAQCYSGRDPLPAMSQLAGEADAQEAAIKWLAFAVLHAMGAGARKIKLSLDHEGQAVVTAEYRPASLPSPGPKVAGLVLEGVQGKPALDGAKAQGLWALATTTWRLR